MLREAGASMGHPLRTRTSAPLRLTDNEFTVNVATPQPEYHLHFRTSMFGEQAAHYRNDDSRLEPRSEAKRGRR